MPKWLRELCLEFWKAPFQVAFWKFWGWIGGKLWLWVGFGMMGAVALWIGHSVVALAILIAFASMTVVATIERALQYWRWIPAAAREMRAMPIASSTKGDIPQEEIRFDYLPDSPIAHGWKQGYAKNPVPSDAIWKMGADGSMLMELSNIYCAIDYRIPERAALSTRLVCDFRFLQGAMLFVLVGLITRDGSKNREGFIKYELGRGRPYYTEEYNEWVFPIDPPSLGNGWHRIDISLMDSVNRQCPLRCWN